MLLWKQILRDHFGFSKRHEKTLGVMIIYYCGNSPWV